jgi:hypothetical protein
MDKADLQELCEVIIAKLYSEYGGNKTEASNELFRISEGHFKCMEDARGYLRYRILRKRPDRATPETASYSNTLNVKGNEAKLVGTCKHRVKSEQDLIETFDVDVEIWFVESWSIGVHELGYVKSTIADGAGGKENVAAALPLYRCSAKLKRRTAYLNMKDDVELFIKMMKKAAPKFPKINVKRRTGEQGLAVCCMFDVHYGKYSWDQEVGDGEYNRDIAKKRMKDSVEHQLSRMGDMSLERIMFPVGNDFLHIDSTRNGTGSFTTAGTPQDTDGRMRQLKREGLAMLIETINLYAGLGCPVDILSIPGNHDTESTIDLSEMLDAYYSRNKKVTVDIAPMPRKYYQYNECGFMLHHGNKIKPALQAQTFATEAPEIWASSSSREIFLGHLHRTQTLVSPVDEHGGCILRYLPSLSGDDKWHHDAGYTSNRVASQLLTYSATGITNIIPWSPPKQASA